MKASDLIARLQTLVAAHGDIDVRIGDLAHDTDAVVVEDDLAHEVGEEPKQFLRITPKPTGVIAFKSESVRSAVPVPQGMRPVGPPMEVRAIPEPSRGMKAERLFVVTAPISEGHFEEGRTYTIEQTEGEQKLRWTGVRPHFDHTSGYVSVRLPIASGRRVE